MGARRNGAAHGVCFAVARPRPASSTYPPTYLLVKPKVNAGSRATRKGRGAQHGDDGWGSGATRSRREGGCVQRRAVTWGGGRRGPSGLLAGGCSPPLASGWEVQEAVGSLGWVMDGGAFVCVRVGEVSCSVTLLRGPGWRPAVGHQGGQGRAQATAAAHWRAPSALVHPRVLARQRPPRPQR